MKKSILALSSALILNLGVNATVLTVSNNPYSPGQYTTIQDACNAAANNDTIYVHGSLTTYGDAEIMKPLVIIGAGAMPDKKFSYATVISALSFKYNSNNTNSGSGSKLYGCDLSGTYFYSNNAGVSVTNILVERNQIGSVYFGTTITGGYSGVVVKNNIIGGIHGHNEYIVNLQIRNNIILEYIGSLGNNTSGPVIANNIFHKSSRIENVKSASIYNNIFYASTALTSAVSGSNNYCSISNNCFVGTHNYTASSVVYGTNSGGNNLLNVDPMFIEDGSTLGIMIWNYKHTPPTNGPYVNYNLQAGSPCIGSGVGGTNMGIYGGSTPFFEGIPNNSRYRYFPMPNIPTMLDMNITNSNILPNGTLNVEFKARKQN